ncbi:MAG: ATP synthase F0 subunit B [Myxococcota bacterium]|nr:ATP synthase F0 subunit B [Myxococcota bacterium]
MKQVESMVGDPERVDRARPHGEIRDESRGGEICTRSRRGVVDGREQPMHDEGMGQHHPLGKSDGLRDEVAGDGGVDRKAEPAPSVGPPEGFEVGDDTTIDRTGDRRPQEVDRGGVELQPRRETRDRPLHADEVAELAIDHFEALAHGPHRLRKLRTRGTREKRALIHLLDAHAVLALATHRSRLFSPARADRHGGGIDLARPKLCLRHNACDFTDLASAVRRGALSQRRRDSCCIRWIDTSDGADYKQPAPAHGFSLVAAGFTRASDAGFRTFYMDQTTLVSLASGGHPLIDIDLTVVVQFALFLILMFATNKLLFQPYLALRERRTAGIDGARGEAQRMTAEADAKLADYEKSLSIARDRANEEGRKVRGEAAAHERDVTEQARAHAQIAIDEAQAKMRAEAEAARGQLLPQADALASRIASKLLGREIA